MGSQHKNYMVYWKNLLTKKRIHHTGDEQRQMNAMNGANREGN